MSPNNLPHLSMNSFHDGPTNNACNGALVHPKGRNGVSPPNGGKSPIAPSTALTVIARDDDVNSVKLHPFVM